jgi:hypothetical protein
MTPAEIDRVFGRGRLRMVTGDHVEVFREAALPGERRCYTKRFLATPAGDFREWTEREWRILARLVGHGIKPVPDVVQFDRGAADRPALVQTYDAGVTVDHWATLLPLERDGVLLRNVFEDCAHWWALARASLVALDAIHELQLVHLDLKADNICIPVGPVGFDPLAGARALYPRFDDITLIDFAFSLVSGERLQSALPIAAQPDYDYQSPRLLAALEAGREGDLAATRQLDWRCDLFSLAAMLWRYLPEFDHGAGRPWTRPRHANARAFVRRLIEVHDGALPLARPHADLIAQASQALAQPDLRHSLQRGWTLAIDAGAVARAVPTPVTRIALPLFGPAGASAEPVAPAPIGPMFERAATPAEASAGDRRALTRRLRQRQRTRVLRWSAALGSTAAAVAATALLVPASWFAPSGVPALLRSHSVAGDAIARAPVPAVPSPASRAAPAASFAAPSAAVVAAALPAPPPALAVDAAPHRSTPADAAAGDAPRPGPAPVAQPARPAPARAKPASVPVPVAVPAARSSGTAIAAVRPAPRSPGATREAAATPVPRLAPRAASPPPARPMAFPSRETILAYARARAARAQLEATSAGTVPPAATAARVAPSTPSSGDNAYPWAVAGKPPGAAAAPPLLVRASTSAPAAAVPAAAPGTDARSSDVVAAAPDFAGRANDLMANHVPRLAQRAERQVARVLFVAGRSADVFGDGAILDSAAALASPAVDPVWGMTLSPGEAQWLGDAARSEYGRRGPTAQALMLQVRAFGADPLDPDVAGNLAFLLLRQKPAQPEAARRLALHALTLHGSRYPQGRLEDWATLAIASALTGRERDATNAFLVSLALAPDLDRHCRAALDAYAMYGERLRVPVETMLASVGASRRAPQAPACQGFAH